MQDKREAQHERGRKEIKKDLRILGIASVLFFVVTFIVYFFNLDMKAAAALEPYLEKCMTVCQGSGSYNEII